MGVDEGLKLLGRRVLVLLLLVVVVMKGADGFVVFVAFAVDVVVVER